MELCLWLSFTLAFVVINFLFFLNTCMLTKDSPEPSLSTSTTFTYFFSDIGLFNGCTACSYDTGDHMRDTFWEGETSHSCHNIFLKSFLFE